MKKLIPYAHWLLRLALAAVFIYHGLTKLPKAEMLSLAMQMPLAVIYILGLVETAAGLMVIIGAFGVRIATRLAGALIAVVMLGAIKIHWGQWSFMASETHPMGGIEFQVVLLLLAVYLLIKGNEA